MKTSPASAFNAVKLLRWCVSIVCIGFILPFWFPTPRSEANAPPLPFTSPREMVALGALLGLCLVSLPARFKAKCAVGVLLIIATVFMRLVYGP